MQHDPATANTHTDPWKNQGSLGFSTWQRHVGLGLAEGCRGDPGTLGNQSDGSSDRGGFQAVYKRHAEGLITRKHPQNTSMADSGRFVYAPPITRLQRYSHITASPAQPQPSATTVLQRQPNHGLFQPTNQYIVTGATAPARSQLDSQVVSRVAECGRSPILGSETAAILPPDDRISGEGSIGLPKSSTGSSESRITGGAALSISHQPSPALARLPLISRSLMAPGIIHRLAHSSERIRRSYKQADVEPGSNTEAGRPFNAGLSHPIRSAAQNLLPGYAERQGSGQHLQPPGSRALPLIPLVTEAGTISRSAAYIDTAPVRQRHDISDRSLPSALSGGSQSNWTMPGRVLTSLAMPNKIRRKQAVDGIPEIEARSQDSHGSIRESLPVVTGAGVPSFNERTSSHEAGISRGETFGSISHALRRVTDTSYTSSHALPLAVTGGREIARPGLTARSHDSIALTYSTSTHSAPAHSSSVSADDRSGVALYPIQDDVGVNAPSHLVKRIQRTRSPIVLTAQQPRSGKGREEYPEAGRYEAGSLPAVQLLLSKTSPLTAHRRIVTPQQLSISSVHSPGARDMVALPRPSEQVLQKKPVSLLTARLRPLDHAAMPEAAHILRRTSASPRESVPFGPINHGINHSGPPITEIIDRSVVATAVDTGPNLLSRAFLPLSRQAGIARFGDVPPVARSSTDTSSGINPADIGSTAVDSMGNGLINSTPMAIARSPDIDAVDMGGSGPPYRASIRLSRSRSTPVASSGAAGSPDHVQGPLRLKPLALASSLDRVMRRVIARSTQQQGLSMSDGRDISASGPLDRYNATLGTGHSISESPSGWMPHERPLAVLQRAPETIMQAPVQRDAIPAAFDRPEERYGLVSPPGEQATNTTADTGEENKAQQSGAGQIDTEEIAEQVWQIMAERLVIEQERRGHVQWL